jgi:hypothetical protein
MTVARSNYPANTRSDAAAERQLLNNNLRDATMKHPTIYAASLIFLGSASAGAGTPARDSTRLSMQVHPPFGTCAVRIGHPGMPDIPDCTSAVLPHSSITCFIAIGGATQCHLAFDPSGRTVEVAVKQSVGNGTDSTVHLTCPGNPKPPYGLQCTIQIRPNPDFPAKG